jgi:excisionase family DNA binding protein
MKDRTEDARVEVRGVDIPTVMTVDELAQVMRLDKKTIYEQIAAGTLPGVRRCGRSLRIHRDTIMRWLAGNGGVDR